MMKKLVVFVLFFVSISMQGQVWIDTGATWHYSKSGLFQGFEKIEYIGDTLIQNKTCQNLQVTSHTLYPIPTGGNVVNTSISHQYTYASGDTVFYQVNDAFYVLYNFGAQVGDTWNLGVDTNELMCGQSLVEVVGTGTSEINGELHEWISVTTLPNSSVGFDGKIFKRFGAVGSNFLFPTHRNCDPDIVVEFFMYQFSCFQDDSFTLYNSTNQHCEYLLHTGIADIENPEIPVTLFPNPASNILSVHVHKQYGAITRITITDMQGRRMKTAYEPEIDISELPQGVYIIRIELSNKQAITEIFIKN